MVLGCAPEPQELDGLTGTLEGFWHHSAQCAYLAIAEDDRLSLRVPDGMRLRIEEGRPEDDDVAILASDGSVVAAEGDTIRVAGTVKELAKGAPCGEPRLLRATEVTVP